MMEVINTREVAHGIWLIILSGWAITQPEIRKHFAALLRAVSHPKLVVAYVGFALYTAAVIPVMRTLGLWTPVLLKDTIVWFGMSGLTLLFSGVHGGQDSIGWRRIVADQVKAALLLEYLVNTYTFPLAVELVLAPLLGVIVTISLFAASRDDARAVVRCATALQAGIGITILVAALYQALSQAGKFVPVEALRTMALPLVLSLVTLPCAYAIALYCAYESLFIRLQFRTKPEPHVVAYAKRRLFLAFGVRVREAEAFMRMHAIDLIEASATKDIDRMLGRWEAHKAATATPQNPALLPQAKIVDTRIVPFTPPGRLEAQMVLIDWKNTGSVPIKEIWASLSIYDDSGHLLKDASCSRYCIFAVEDEHAIQPGQTYIRPGGTGFVLFPFEGKASRAQVDILEARSAEAAK